jgi:thiamine biosynthesis lipoprotein
MKLDLGGVAKGYALDRMLPLLERHGIESALLNFGQSSTWAVGAPAGSAGWRLLVRGPEGRFAGLITLRDQALSVSGSQGHWVEIGGRGAQPGAIGPRRGDGSRAGRRPARLRGVVDRGRWRVAFDPRLGGRRSVRAPRCAR